MIIKIKFANAIALNISRFYILFYKELIILFNYVERKAKASNSIITEKLFYELRSKLREKQDRMDSKREDA